MTNGFLFKWPTSYCSCCNNNNGQKLRIHRALRVRQLLSALHRCNDLFTAIFCKKINDSPSAWPEESHLLLKEILKWRSSFFIFFKGWPGKISKEVSFLMGFEKLLFQKIDLSVSLIFTSIVMNYDEQPKKNCEPSIFASLRRTCLGICISFEKTVGHQ